MGEFDEFKRQEYVEEEFELDRLDHDLIEERLQKFIKDNNINEQWTIDIYRNVDQEDYYEVLLWGKRVATEEEIREQDLRIAKIAVGSTERSVEEYTERLKEAREHLKRLENG